MKSRDWREKFMIVMYTSTFSLHYTDAYNVIQFM